MCIGSSKNKFNVGNLLRLNCFLCSFVPSKEPKPHAGNDFVTHVRLSACCVLRVLCSGFNRLPAALGCPQKLLMAQGKVHKAYDSAWDEIFTVALPAFILSLQPWGASSPHYPFFRGGSKHFQRLEIAGIPAE